MRVLALVPYAFDSLYLPFYLGIPLGVFLLMMPSRQFKNSMLEAALSISSLLLSILFRLNPW